MENERKKQLESIFEYKIDMGASLEERLKLCTPVLDTIKHYKDTNLKKTCLIEFPNLILYWKQTFGDSEKIIEDKINMFLKKCPARKDMPRWFWDIVSRKLLIPPSTQTEFLNLVVKVYAVL